MYMQGLEGALRLLFVLGVIGFASGVYWIIRAAIWIFEHVRIV